MAEELGIEDSPPGFPTMFLHATIDVTIELTRRNPELAKDYGAAGFEAVWRALLDE